MAVTPDFNLPYPDPTATANVPRDFKALAEAIEAALKDLGVDVLDVFDSTDKTLPPSADALRRGLETKQNVLRLADNYLAASVLVNAAPDGSGRSYPDGVSMFKVSSSAGGWPASNGYVLTFRAGSGGYQIFYEMYTGAVQTDKTARQWTRSKRDSNAFWQDWARAATEVDIATLLPLAGGDMTGAIKRTYQSQYANSVKVYRNVAGNYVSNLAGQKGAIKIALPRTSFSGTALKLIINGRNHLPAVGTSNHDFQIVASAYLDAANGGTFNRTSAILSGDANFNTVSWVFDGANICLVLGDVNTSWNYPSIEVTDVHAHLSSTDGLDTGWAITLITDTTSFSKTVTPTLQKLATQAYTDTAVATHNADYVRQPGYAATAGTGAAYTVTLSPAPAALVDGLAITIVPHTDNTAADPTLKIGSLAALPIRRQSGAQFATGSIKAGQPLSLIKVGSYFLARSTSPVGTATPDKVLAGETFMSAAYPDGATGTRPAGRRYWSQSFPADTGASMYINPGFTSSIIKFLASFTDTPTVQTMGRSGSGSPYNGQINATGSTAYGYSSTSTNGVPFTMGASGYLTKSLGNVSFGLTVEGWE